MAAGFSVDAGEVEGIGRRLRDEGSSLDSLGGSTPQGVDAGQFTAAITSMIARAADVAGELATGLLDVGDALKTGAAVYQATDAGNAGRFELDGDRPGRAR